MLSSVSSSNFNSPAVELMSYHEDQGYLVYNKPEPSGRSQILKLRSHDHVWWVRVTFIGTIYQLQKQGDRKKRKFERRKEFQEFVQSINYCSISLLDDTVTELVLTLSQEPMNLIKAEYMPQIDSNIFIDHAKCFDYKIHVDPKRVVYPPYSEFPSFWSVDISRVSVEIEIHDGRVFQVRLGPDYDKQYIYKTVERPFYNPMDTEVIRKELENLKLVQDLPNITQLAGVVVSANPYMTSRRSDPSPIITGILLEFYGGGSLKEILDGHHLDKCDWQKCALQIGTALSQLHNIGQTHMDIKPSNIVFDLEVNAILIDIGGMGVTYSWLAPEMKEVEQAIDKPFEMRLLHDTWAYGKLLLEIAMHIDANPFAAQLRGIAAELMQKEPKSRMSLAEAINQLREPGLQNSDRSAPNPDIHPN